MDFRSEVLEAVLKTNHCMRIPRTMSDERNPIKKIIHSSHEGSRHVIVVCLSLPNVNLLSE